MSLPNKHKETSPWEYPSSYSPDYHPIEYLWKKVKTKATRNRYFDEFVKLIASVNEAISTLATQADEIKRLMGVYTKHLASPVSM